MNFMVPPLVPLERDGAEGHDPQTGIESRDLDVEARGLPVQVVAVIECSQEDGGAIRIGRGRDRDRKAVVVAALDLPRVKAFGNTLEVELCGGEVVELLLVANEVRPIQVRFCVEHGVHAIWKQVVRQPGDCLFGPVP